MVSTRLQESKSLVPKGNRDIGSVGFVLEEMTVGEGLGMGGRTLAIEGYRC